MGSATGQVMATAKLLGVGALLVGLYGYARPASSGGWAELNRAMVEGDSQAVQSLLDAGAAMNSRDEIGETPLHRAACAGNLESAQLLMERGAEVNAQDANGQSPLAAAAASSHADVV